MSKQSIRKSLRFKSVSRRGALAALGVGTLAAGASSPVHANEQYAERFYEGESKAGNLQEALDAATAKLSGDLSSGGVSDALANWRLCDVTGQLGGIAGFHSVKVRIAATRTPPYPRKA